jgi:hypothetical protein
MGVHEMIKIVCEGGMTALTEIPKQENVRLDNKYFDEHTTYAPFKWLGSRRLTVEELKRYGAPV